MCINLGQQIPDKLAKPPLVADRDYLYLDAYFELDTTRSRAMGIERISFNSIVKYAEFIGLSYTECSDLISIIRLIDNSMIKYYNEK